MAIRLFTSSYDEPSESRRREYLECLQHNSDCGVIDEIHLLVEGAGAWLPTHAGLVRHAIGARPTYADFFARINGMAQPDDLSIIANSDVYFDRSVTMARSLLAGDSCLALSRWDVAVDGSVRLFERADSQDAWIFKGPVRCEGIGQYPVGVYDCDNKIAWELEQAGYAVGNPALSLRTYHLHRGEARSYDPANPPDHGIRPPFRYVDPVNAGSLRACIGLWREYRPGYFPWRMTWLGFLRTRPGRPFRYLRDGMRRRFGARAK
jgi:hypothetical protein